MEKQKKNDSGITLVALVVSIIVMLVLAGVSLNMTIGDNGIISQAQDAKYKIGMAALEEWLQQKYVEYYDDNNNYTSKIDMLVSKMPKIFLKDGTKGYITYGGNIYYLINKSNLPNEIKDSLVGGDTNEYSQYIRLKDVYGVTSELKVYYCENGIDSAWGTTEAIQLDPSTPLAQVNSNQALKTLLTDRLTELGVEIDESGNIVAGNVSSLTELTIDGSKYNITDLTGISELRNLKQLYLKNVNLNNLNGIESLSLLYYISITKSVIGDYSKINQVLDLQYLYMINTTNSEISKLSDGLSTGNLSKLAYFGIYGYAPPNTGTGRHTYYEGGGTISEVTDISPLSRISESTRDAVKYMYMNNNKLESVSSLSYFKNVQYIELNTNTTLTTLSGLEKLQNLLYICASYCNLSSIDLSLCTNLNQISCNNNANLASLKLNPKITGVWAYNCNLTNITGLSGCTELAHLDIENNPNLVSVSTINALTNIKYLYLLGCTNMLVTDVRNMEPLINSCWGYSLPDKYLKYFGSITILNYKGAGLSGDDCDDIIALNNRTSLTQLNLMGNSNLGKSRLAKLIKDEKLTVAELDTILTRLSLTTTQITYINSLKTSGETAIKALSNETINSMEAENDIYLRYILSGLTSLNILGLSDVNVTSVDFVKYMPNLKVLDLRNTLATDLSILETQTVAGKLKLESMCLSNTGIDLTKIQTVISNLTGAYTLNYLNMCSSGSSKYGLCLTDDVLMQKLSGCTNITALHMGCSDWRLDTTVDLHNCTSLTHIRTYGSSNTFIYPPSIDHIDRQWTSGYFDDFTYVVGSNGTTKKITYLYYGHADFTGEINGQTRLNTCLKSISCNVETLGFTMYGSTTEDLSVIFNGVKCQNINNFFINRYGSGGLINLKNEGTLGNFVNVISMNLQNTNINNLNWVSGLSKLTTLQIWGGGVLTSLSGIENLTTLTYADLHGNNIVELSKLSNLSNLATLHLYSNSLENTYNITENNKIVVIDNIDVLKKLHDNKVLRNLTISDNYFTNTEELKKLSWDYYVE